MKIKRDRRGLRVPGIRNRLNGDDSMGFYALMDWYCQGHLEYEDVLRRCQKYIGLYQKVKAGVESGERNTRRHLTQLNCIYMKMVTLIMVLSDWDKRKFS